MTINSFPLYERVRKPVRLRMLRIPTGGWLFYQSPQVSVSASSIDDSSQFCDDVERKLDELTGHFLRWARVNRCDIAKVQRVAIRYSHPRLEPFARRWQDEVVGEYQQHSEMAYVEEYPERNHPYIEIQAVFHRK